MGLGPLVRSWRSDHAREGRREGGRVMSECDTISGNGQRVVKCRICLKRAKRPWPLVSDVRTFEWTDVVGLCTNDTRGGPRVGVDGAGEGLLAHALEERDGFGAFPGLAVEVDGGGEEGGSVGLVGA